MPKQKRIGNLSKSLLSRRFDAPIGQRNIDAPANPAMTRVRLELVRQVELFNEAAAELVPMWDSDNPDHFALKLAICKATGVQPGYDLGGLSCVAGDRLVHNAARMKSEELDRIRQAVREVQAACAVKRESFDHWILVALLEGKAFSYNARITQSALAPKASAGATAENLKAPVTSLKKRGLVDTKPGRAGGVWLTPAGRAAAESLRANG
jgi:hypothetical protein